MEDILLPSTIELTPGEDDHKATLTIEPCFHGYGTTLGNALRRVMLSSLPGAAVVAVKIKGVAHEFSAMPGVKEDVLEVLLNLKSLRLRVFTEGEEPIRLHLIAKGEKEVTAADIEASSDVEIANTDVHIATLTDKKSELDMEIFIGRGRGYVPVEERSKEKNELGMISIDSVFSPVRDVGYRVDNVRVGQITNFDKLVMTIETDGTITPEAAVDQSVKILLDHFNLVLHRGVLPVEESAVSVQDAPPVQDEDAEPAPIVDAADEAPKKVKKAKKEKK